MKWWIAGLLLTVLIPVAYTASMMYTSVIQEVYHFIYNETQVSELVVGFYLILVFVAFLVSSMCADTNGKGERD